MIARNSLVDGCRGLSVLLVIVGHVVGYRFALTDERSLPEIGLSFGLIPSLTSRIFSHVGDLGVDIFFVISGFLITTLLLKEERENHRVNIGAFYIRRVFRILPAFFVYLFALYVVRAHGFIKLENEAFVRSALFTCDFSDVKCSWWLGHTWSLAIEEQFYLAWPLLFVVFRTIRVPTLLATLLILIGVSTYNLVISGFESIALGALVAASPRVRNFLSRFATHWSVSIAVVALLARPLLTGRLVGLMPESLQVHFYALLYAIVAGLVALVFFGTIARKGPLVPFVESRLIQKIGLFSYSIYLWQQLGTAPEVWLETITGADVLYARYPIAASMFTIPAVASYFLIEKPFVRVGKALSDAASIERRGLAEPSLAKCRGDSS
jgi:peptidoglycan/LPS O-acetylase OafA/YrhL